MKENVLSVSQLNDYLQALLRSDPILCNLSVSGEVTGYRRHSSGHLYFSLKDENALVRCVMFRQAAQTLRFAPADGMQITVRGYASLYTKDGQFQIYVQSMRQQGEGELYRRYLLLKSRLEAEGYFDQAHKKAIPFLPEKVGIITSASGAALQDILQIIRRRYPTMNITICPVQVQGVTAAAQIAAAIRYMNAESDASVLIVGRGGGSIEDLWAFNEVPVAEAIYHSRIPVISAVGHETDFTIADFVADLRAPTPSAAAELCVPEFAALAQQADSLYQRLPEATARCLSRKKEKLRLLLHTRGFLAAGHMIALKQQILTNMGKELSNFTRASILKQKSLLFALCMRLEALSPRQMLQRGYAFVTGGSGNVVGGVSQLRGKDTIYLHMHDGMAVACIEQIKNEAGNNHAGRKDI